MPFIFNDNYIEVFKELKERLISSPILRHYDLDLKLMLETNASDGVMAGILL